MFTIPSTHLVIIGFSDPGNRMQRFLRDKNKAQYTLLIGSHFGDLQSLVDNYLPKSAIDRLTIKMKDLIGKRDLNTQNGQPATEPSGEHSAPDDLLNIPNTTTSSLPTQDSTNTQPEEDDLPF